MSPYLASLMSHPAAILFVISGFFLVYMKYMGTTLGEFVATLNVVGTQPFALIVLVIGFWMLVVCKSTGIDTTIAGGVIGVASNMLQSQLKEANHKTPNSASDTPEVKP